MIWKKEMSDKRTVLIVDDDPDFLIQQRTGVESLGYEVVLSLIHN